MAKLPIYRIYSLNIDDSFENTLRKFSPHNFEVLSRNSFINDISTFDPVLSLIKLNGDIQKPEISFIFSASEYAKESHMGNKWYQELARDFNRYTFLFIGTQLNEPLLRFHIEKYKQLHDTDIVNPKSYLLTPKISGFEKINLERSNIHHIEGTMELFDKWISEHLNDLPTYEDIAKAKRPYMAVVKSMNKDQMRDVLATSYSITDIQEVITSTEKTSNNQPTTFNKFYQGFKPEWKDILNQVPSKLSRVNNFYNENFINKTPLKNSLYLIYGAAGSGKTTSLMQTAYLLKNSTNNNVYYIDRNYESLSRIVQLLDQFNSDTYYIFIDKIIQGYDELSEIIKKNKSKAVFIISEDIKIWEYKAKEYLGGYLTESVDISFIEKKDVPLILKKIETHGIWTRLSRMSQQQREQTLYQKSKSQLLIGLLETTSGEGYERIIYNDFNSIQGGNERSLLLLCSIAAVQNLPSYETTLLRALSNLNYNNQSIHFIVSRKLAGILSYNNGLITTRHRLYSDKLFDFVSDKAELQLIVIAYISAFSKYKSPIVTTVKSKSEANIFKHLVNFKFLNKLLNNNKELVLDVYRKFEKVFEHEGLFLMQYGLALRSFGMHYDALEILATALDAFPNSNHIEHALAHQKLIIAYEYPFASRSRLFLEEA
ncbi:P-loop NTPase, partial [Psychrobacter immobilis]|uniref:P-loop NTPase n=1 Tax=Psychrobacter immobilis TaxID=498 RepID=UPI003FD4E5FE